MPIIDTSFEQRSEEWNKARLGNPGCSGMSNIITPDGKRSKSRDGYLYTLVAEKLSGKSDEKYMSQHMINGTEREDSCRLLFEMLYDCKVDTCGIVWKDNYKLVHCSPDGMISDNAILEMKNPLGKTVVKNLLDGTLPSEYYVQCQSSLYVCERELLYFMSNYDGLKPLIVEVYRDDKWISILEKELTDFNTELLQIAEKLKQ